MDIPQKFTWEEGALALLESRDRYTRKTIREDFRDATPGDVVEFDSAGLGYLTRVSDGRFSVVWYLDKERHQGVVRAVLPLTDVNGPPERLKAYVERAIQDAFKQANVR